MDAAHRTCEDADSSAKAKMIAKTINPLLKAKMICGDDEFVTQGKMIAKLMNSSHKER